MLIGGSTSTPVVMPSSLAKNTFVSRVKSIEVFRKQPSTLLIADIEGEYSYDYSLNGSYLEVLVKKVSKEEAAKSVNIMPGRSRSSNKIPC